jgi:hypothetical protein
VLELPLPHALSVSRAVAVTATRAGIFMGPPVVFIRRYDEWAMTGSTTHL